VCRSLNHGAKATVEAVNAGLASSRYLGQHGQVVDRIVVKEAAWANTLGLKFASNKNLDGIRRWVAGSQ